MEGIWIAVASFIISATTLLLGGIGLKQKAKLSYTEQLEKTLNDIKEKLSDCQSESRRLRDENIMLMRKILEVEKGKK